MLKKKKSLAGLSLIKMRAFMLTLKDFFKLAVRIEVERDQDLHVTPT